MYIHTCMHTDIHTHIYIYNVENPTCPLEQGPITARVAHKCCLYIRTKVFGRFHVGNVGSYRDVSTTSPGPLSRVLGLRCLFKLK